VADPGEDPDVTLAGYAEALADGVESALPVWVKGCVDRVVRAWNGDVSRRVEAAAEAAAASARRDVGSAVRHLLMSDLDDQKTTPLAILRTAVRYPTAVLTALEVPPVERDRFSAEAFPDDVYDLSPSSLADISPELADVGIAWGAAKAFVHRRRHGGSAG
jgi:hypothetical protein